MATNEPGRIRAAWSFAMDWTHYVFRFDGRIDRAGFWFGLLTMFCGMFVLLAFGAGLNLLFGGDGSFSLDTDDVFRIVDPATYRLAPLAKLPLVAIKLAATALMVWVYVAIAIKRLHDRDRSAWWMVAFFVLPGLYNQFDDRLPDSYWILPLALAAGVLCLWGGIEMGFLRGSPRTNRFGPDPLDKVQTRPRGEAPSVPHATGWDQQAELEFVPHSASPPDGMHVKRGA